MYSLAKSERLEARAGIEPACEDLQSSTSPLRHRASRRCVAMVSGASQVKLYGLTGRHPLPAALT